MKLENLVKKGIIVLLTFSITGCSIWKNTNGKGDDSSKNDTISEKNDVEDSNNAISNVENNESIIQEGTMNQYFYNQLSTTEKSIYSEIYNHLNEAETEFDINNCGLDGKAVINIFQTVVKDCPDLFYCTGGCSSKQYSDHTIIDPVYCYSYSEITNYKNQLNTISNQYLNTIQSMNIDEILEYTHDYIVDHCTYDYDASKNANSDNYYSNYPYSISVIGGLITGKAVCEGYSKAFQYLMNLAGYECIYVTGTAKGGAHAWNAVNIDGTYYYFDVTWDDTVGEGLGIKVYTYFGLCSEQIKADHTADNFNEYSNDIYYNYAVMHGYYLSSMDDYADAMEKQSGNQSIMIQCISDDLYNTVFNQLINKHDYTNYLQSNSIYYAENEDYHILYIYPNNG